jgi:type VI secretion system secreted protein VgrG
MKLIDVVLESTDFDATRFRVRELTGREALSELFAFDVRLAMHGLPMREPLIGQSATLVFSDRGQPVRKVHGLIAECLEEGDGGEEATIYRIRLVPHFHWLSLVTLQRVIVSRSVPQILEKKLENGNLSGELRLAEEYGTETQTVQYKESDLDFLRRLCEHEGITFFFEHGAPDGPAVDRVVFADSNAALGPKDSVVRLRRRYRGDRTGVFRLDRQTRMMPNYFVVADYCDKRPFLDLSCDHKVVEEGGGGVIEYGSNHSSVDQGKRLARVRGEEAASLGLFFLGASDEPSLAAPCRLKVDDPRLVDEHDLLVIEVEHRFSAGGGRDGTGRALSYENTFRAIPFSQPYRPPRITPKPRIHGLVTGVVEALAEGLRTPFLDEAGRYTVRFHFDFEPHFPIVPTGVRMAQPSAGANGGYGMHFPLRPGTEVLVGFIDGDPDRPIIVGALPNAHAPSPVTSSTPTVNRLVSASGVVFEMNDGD